MDDHRILAGLTADLSKENFSGRAVPAPAKVAIVMMNSAHPGHPASHPRSL